MKEIVVLLDNVRSALNVGAIFRTADGAGIKKLYLVGITPYPPHPKLLKTSLGAENSIESEHIDNPIEIITEYKKQGFSIISIEENPKATDFFKTNLNSDKLLVVFGHEITGVSNKIMDSSDHVLKLPMAGVKNSLNVSTTVGIVLYNLQFGR